MPAPARTGRDEIVTTASALLDERGTEGVTMQAVAQRVGVQPPSLYKHVRHRRELLAAVVTLAVAQLTARLETVRDPADPSRSLVAQVTELRRFAHERPRAFALVMGATPDLPRPDPAVVEASLTGLFEATTALVGPEHALDAARLVVAWANGFITMELTDALQLGGSIDAAWTWGLERIVRALGAQAEAGTEADAARAASAARSDRA